MSILTTTNVGQNYGALTVFTGVNVSVARGAKIGLVGPNGAGKTTLLLILAGLEQPSPGQVHTAAGTRIGYLRQEAMQAFAEQTNTVLEEMLTVFAGVQEQEARMRELEHLMGDGDADFDAVSAEYGALVEHFERIGGYDYETRIQQTLGGLGFYEHEYDTPLNQLSGGQKTRALLARLLLEQPDLLILDEPTNHLDVGAIEWLEGALLRYSGAVILVSHDRYFLDRVVNTIWELAGGVLETFRGNYSAYLLQREERHEYALKLYEQEMERMWKEYQYIKANIDRDATNPQAVGRLRRLSRDVVAINEIGFMGYMNARKWIETGVGGVRFFTIYEMERELKAIQPPVRRAPKLVLRIKPPQRSGEYVVKGRNLSVGYAPDKPLFFAGEFRLGRGDCTALIGDNGTGKTTFLKTIRGELPPLSGTYDLGVNVQIGYFSQAHDGLNLSNSVLDELTTHKRMGHAEARNLLAQYLFRGDDVFKRVGDLSGGERGKLALLILALQGANFLILDEPTNHLDIPAQEVLQSVLEQFSGTILIVSHDRYLIDRLATRIWHIEDSELRLFDGTYQEYMADRQRESDAARAERAAEKARERVAKAERPRVKTPQELAEIEARIHSAETTLNELTRLIDRAASPEDVQRLGTQYAEHQAQLEALMQRWEQIAAGSLT
jgi:ATP-binding cassette subfamily F protein 3